MYAQGKKYYEPFKHDRVPDYVLDLLIFKPYPQLSKYIFHDLFLRYKEQVRGLHGSSLKYKRLHEAYWNSHLMNWFISIVQANLNYRPFTISRFNSRLVRVYGRLYRKRKLK